MPIDSPDTIDIISVNAEAKVVTLTMVDHLEWTQEDHPALFGAKLNGYLGYLLSGQIARDHPEWTGMSAAIEITCLHEPTAEAQQMFEKVGEAPQPLSVAFSWKQSSFPKSF